MNESVVLPAPNGKDPTAETRMSVCYCKQLHSRHGSVRLRALGKAQLEALVFPFLTERTCRVDHSFIGYDFEVTYGESPPVN